MALAVEVLRDGKGGSGLCWRLLSKAARERERVERGHQRGGKEEGTTDEK